MRNPELNSTSTALHAAGALLRAANAVPDGYEIHGQNLVVTDPMLADKVLSAIKAGGQMPADLTHLSFGDTLDLGTILLGAGKYLAEHVPLVADHPEFKDRRAE